MTRAILLAAVCALAACSSLSPAQRQSEGEVRSFADRTARAYGLPPIHVLVGHNPADPPGSYRRGYFSVSATTLTSTFRDAIVAHELAHYVLGHDAALPGETPEEMRRAYQQRELDANAKSVGILMRVDGMTEERALKTVYAYLLGVHWALERYPRLNLSGHKPPCDEIADLVARFPEQREWTGALSCATPPARDAAGR